MWTAIVEKLKGWKTVIANSITGAAGVLYFLYLQFQAVDFSPVIPPKYMALFVFGMSALGIILRVITTGPVGSKGMTASTPETKAGD